MKNFILGSIALGLMVGAPLNASISVSSSDDSLAEAYSRSGLSIDGVSSNGLVGLLPTNDDKSFVVFWRNTYPDLVSLDCSFSVASDSSSATGFLESYSYYDCSYIGNVSSEVYAYSVRHSFSDRVMVRQAKYYSPTPVGIGREYVRNADSTVSVKEFNRIQVTDYLVSYFNIVNGRSEMLDFLGLANSQEFYQEHYVAFNFDIDIDEIKSIEIQSAFDTISGDTDVTCGLNYDAAAFDWGKMGFSDFEKSQYGCSKGNVDSHVFNVFPKDILMNDTTTLFGNYHYSYPYSFNTVIDCRNDDFSASFKKIFDGESYNSLSSVMKNDDGSLKYRWFVRFSENKVGNSAVKHVSVHGDVSMPIITTFYTFKVDPSSPFMKGKDTAIISVNYVKDGKEYKAVVVSDYKDSTDDPENPLSPVTDEGLKDWQIAVLVCIGLAMLLVLGMVVKPIGAAVKFILKVIWFVVESAIDFCYLLLVWWWLAIVRKANGEDVPPLWLWRKK